MPGGEYEAILKIFDSKGKNIAETEQNFTLIQTPVSMFKYHFDELLKQLELVASQPEIEELENADTTPVSYTHLTLPTN